MIKELDFSSKLDQSYLDNLRQLFFFNKRQENYRPQIIELIKEYGEPVIVRKGENIFLQLTDEKMNQCLFAKYKDDLVGAVLYTRNTTSNISILHIAIDESYFSNSQNSNFMLSLQLINKVKEIAKKIKGIETISLEYSRKSDKKITLPVKQIISI